ncbi:TetR family transcriptional regulator [Umezawaea beigongshangensis]|uniref:TetR/AcrR family transcriptional regulator n=1 Tax=Umezawaea beigongshangensis TaxID=2780383 RepID=UPI0018F210F6|nr:TetR family transcriptional regulator [Umezawaea beigongshangensis]
MTGAVEQGDRKRRGRRAAGQDTRAALLTAARALFVERGYEGATVRAIAARAGVDAAMVNHWFGGKEALFGEAVLQLPVDPAAVVERVLDGPPERIGERIVRTFLGVWDDSGGGAFAALVRSVTAHDEVARVLQEFFLHTLFARVLASLDVDQADLRATLCATQVVGVGMVRYVLRFEPLVSAEVDTVVAAVAPTLQRYLLGDISAEPG